jgi:hypothetical protein
MEMEGGRSMKDRDKLVGLQHLIKGTFGLNHRNDSEGEVSNFVANLLLDCLRSLPSLCFVTNSSYNLIALIERRNEDLCSDIAVSYDLSMSKIR